VNLLPPIATATTAPNLTPLLIAAISKDGLALIGKLAIGDILTGIVTGKRQDGPMIVRTDRGLIALTGAADAPDGSKVTLEVRATGARMQVVLLAMETPDGEPVPVPAQQQPPASRPGAAPAIPTPLPADAAASSGTQIAATVLRAAEPPLPAPGSPPAAPPPVRGQTAAPPASPPMPGQAAAASASPAAAPWLATGQRLSLHVSAVVPPGEPALPASLPAAGFVATVRAVMPNGQPVIDAPLGMLALDKAVNWPVGTQLVASFLAAETPPLPGREPAQRGWTGMQQAAALFDLPDQPALVALLEKTLPRIGPHLAVGLAARLKLPSDEPSVASSELKAALARIGRPELAQQLHQEFAELNRALPPPEQGWRSVILPLVDENRLQQAKLSVRRDPPKDGADPTAVGSIHFLLDVELSRLGPLQLDGLIRGKRLDLMLRSQKPLDAPLRQELNEIFQNAQQATGYAGQLFFQAGAAFLRTGSDSNLSRIIA
jgi:hypothetical protein